MNILVRLATKATPIFLLAYKQPECRGNNLVKLGLIFSGVGDIFLIPFKFQYGLAVGVAAFTFAQVLYITSFGFDKIQVSKTKLVLKSH